MLYGHVASARMRRPLPLSAFLFEGATVFTAAAEYVGDLRDKTGEHGLQHASPNATGDVGRLQEPGHTRSLHGVPIKTQQQLDF